MRSIARGLRHLVPVENRPQSVDNSSLYWDNMLPMTHADMGPQSPRTLSIVSLSADAPNP